MGDAANGFGAEFRVAGDERSEPPGNRQLGPSGAFSVGEWRSNSAGGSLSFDSHPPAHSVLNLMRMGSSAAQLRNSLTTAGQRDCRAVPFNGCLEVCDAGLKLCYGDFMHIVVVCGTNRDGALSRLLAQETAEIYRQRDHNVDLLDMQELPPEVLEPTAYQAQPANVAALVQRFLKADGVVFVIPEYNGSYPGVAENVCRHAALSRGF